MYIYILDYLIERKSSRTNNEKYLFIDTRRRRDVE
jgi:hypothetical protein